MSSLNAKALPTDMLLERPGLGCLNLYGVGTAITVVFDGTLSCPDPSTLVT